MKLYYHPLDTACKSITGGIRENEELTLNVFCVNDNAEKPYKEGDFCATEGEGYFLLAKDGEKEESFPMEKTPFGFSITFSIAEKGLYFYAFSIGSGFIAEGKGVEGYFSNQKGKYFQLTVSKKGYKTPSWFKGGVMYQIFPDRFHKSGAMLDIIGRVNRTDWGGLPHYLPDKNGKVKNNDFFGGNLKGVEEKLNYLSDLGITTIYFNPIFSAKSNHRYDTSNYMEIDEMLGDENDLENLVNSAKNQGISIILDGVFNHTGDDSIYFNKYGNYPNLGAFQSKDSPYYSWYTFTKFPNEYESWWGIDILPQIDERSESYQSFIFGEGGVLSKWISKGIKGYRLDVADELPDFFLQKLRKSVKKADANALIIGEVWEDASNKIAYHQRREYLQGNELDSVMNYPLKNAIIGYISTQNAEILSNTIQTLVDHYPKETLDSLMNILGTHDTARILTVFGGKEAKTKKEMANTPPLSQNEKENAIKKVKFASILQYFMPGVPCIYYGDENAQEGYGDPFCRICFDWEHINESMLTHYQTLGQIRKKYRNILKDGIFKEIHAQRGLYFFKRENKFGSIYIYVNCGKEKWTASIKGKFENLFDGNIFKNKIEIAEESFGIFIKKE